MKSHAARTCITVLIALIAPAAPARGGDQFIYFTDDPALGGFVDIVGFGQPQQLGEDGEAVLALEAFKGNVIYLPGNVVVGQNGGLGFGSAAITELGPDNQPIPSDDAFAGGQAALPFWDDIDDKEGDILFAEIVGDPQVSDRLIVQWEYADFDGQGSILTIQAHIPANFQANGIYSQYVYRIEGPATSAGGSATIGYQDGITGYGDLEYSFNLPGAVTDGTVISLFVPGPGDVDASGRVDIGDLLALLKAWGPCGTCDPCPADVNFDCDVGVVDLLLVLANWDG